MCSNVPKISDFFPFKPTSSQEKVIEELERFMEDSTDHPVLLLRGYAGTGKSSLVGAFAKLLHVKGQPLTLLAPTGRAAKVLQGYCGVSASTIHRHIYRQRIVAGGGVDFDSGYNKDAPNTVYIIDEASMISNVADGGGSFGSGYLLDDLFDFCFSVEGTRILLIGDDAQLPPVGTDLSLALNPRYVRSYCSQLYECALTDIVRQEAESEIVQLSYLLRSRIIDLAQGGTWKEPLLPMPNEQSDVQIISGYELPELIEDSFRKVGEEETVVVTRSNRDAEEFNRSIRHNALYYDEDVIPGEHIMVVRNNYLYRPVDEEDRPLANFIANGEILKVLNTRRTTELHGFTFREAELEDGSGGFVAANVLMESLYSGASSLTPEQRQTLFDSVILDYPECSSRRSLYTKIRKDPYLNALQIKYAYAMTCHKAQGGQWKDVYLSFGFLTPEMIDLSFCRWLYTAMTRATSRLYILNPPKFIFGEIEYN